METYRPTAHNHSESSENRIHSDSAAQKYGFESALVTGVAVFGYMTYPLVKLLGGRWFEEHSASIRLIKPAYHGDVLSINHTERDGIHLIQCRARDDVVVAELNSSKGIPPVSELAYLSSGTPIDERPEIQWDLVEVGKPFPSFRWKPDIEEHLTYTTQIEDNLEIYLGDVLHPHAILDTANRAFANRYKLPAWVHVGSAIHFRELIRIGEEIEVRAVPMRKWRKKGHEFIDLYISCVVGEIVKTEIKHTAIFKIAEQRA
jgi:hypothetical protein